MLRYLICADCYDVELDLKLDLYYGQDFLSQPHIRKITTVKLYKYTQHTNRMKYIPSEKYIPLNRNAIGTAC